MSKWRIVNSVKSLKELLFVDKRIDEDEFLTCDFKLMMRLASLYKKTNLDMLIRLIKGFHKGEFEDPIPWRGQVQPEPQVTE